ncbi:MAG: hypothetical protein WCC14_18335, partial [Acidobacteriaceae bacterium]
MLYPHESTASRPEPVTARDPCLDLISWGVPFRLSASSDALLALMRRRAPFGSAESHDPAPGATTFSLRRIGSEAGYQLLADRTLLIQDEPLDSSLLQLSARLMIHVAECAPDYVFLHAGVVAWQDHALLLPGVSHAGKSTLVAELIRAGATYYSDEFALLDRDGRVHPFTRTLQMRRPGLPKQTPLPLAELNGRAGTDALAVSLVVFTEFTEGARWAPEVLAPGRAVLEMLLHAIPVQRTPAR